MDTLPTLDPLGTRVLGVLIEKELTTPEQYPLSENALVVGCNQKSNRDPVLSLSTADVRLTLEGLRLKGLVGATHPAGGRVERYHHSARPVLEVDGVGLAVLAELMLRGTQSPGELRARASRMTPIESIEELGRELDVLTQRGFVRKLPPLPGSRAARYAQLLCSEAETEPAASCVVPEASPRAAVSISPAKPGIDARVDALESEVAWLRNNLQNLSAKLGEALEG